MASASDHWTVDKQQHLPALTIVLLRQTFILPWTQFLYAEGAPDRIHAVFATHDVLVQGADLDPLLDGFAAQPLTQLREPARADRFAPALGPRITALAVQLTESTKS